MRTMALEEKEAEGRVCDGWPQELQRAYQRKPQSIQLLQGSLGSC